MGKREGIVSSAHLADGDHGELSEVEFGLIIAHNAFSRWVTHCMASSGNGDLSYIDILVLHNVNHRGRPKRVADICYVLNVEDTHTVTYALKKLVRSGLVTGEKSGKEIFYRTSEEGETLCRRYAQTRERCLLQSAGFSTAGKKELEELAKVLRALSGLYDQAGRSAASL